MEFILCFFILLLNMEINVFHASLWQQVVAEVIFMPSLLILPASELHRINPKSPYELILLFFAKNQLPTYSGNFIVILALTPSVGRDEADRYICPFKPLLFYLDCIKPICGSHLWLVCFPLSRRDIQIFLKIPFPAGWVGPKTIKKAYGIQPVNRQAFHLIHPHEIEILHHFSSFYLRNFSFETEGLHTFGPLVDVISSV